MIDPVPYTVRIDGGGVNKCEADIQIHLVSSPNRKTEKLPSRA